MASALSIVLYQTISGPMSSMVRVTNKTVARAQLQSVSNIVIMDALNQAASGDCDADGSVEPRAWRTPPSAPAAPGGGGLIPLSIGAPVVDPWGTDYGYCVWDVGAITTKCGGTAPNMLIGTTSPTAGNAVTQTVMAIVSAGPNRQFQTSCRDYFNTTQDTIFPTGTPASSGAGGDDVVQRFTYTEAASATSSIWSLKVGDPQTAEIDRDLSIGPTAAPVVTVGSTTGIINAIAVQTSGQVTATGGMRVGDENDVTTCSNPGLLRWNTTLSDLEVCNGASGTWIVPGSGAGLPISGLSAATQNKALANAAFEQAWAWSGLAANAAGLSLSSSAPAGAGAKTLSVTNLDATGWALYGTGRTFFSGNVGIGTASPATTLDIFGKHNVTSDCAGATLPCEDTDVQVFTSSGTWNKPAGTTAQSTTYVQCWGAGGGGGGGGGAGSGRRGTTSGTNLNQPYAGKGGGGGTGGTGGIAGSYTEKAILTSSLSATVAVTIGAGGGGGSAGAGGAGGAILGNPGTNGGTGSAGGASTFGALVAAAGGTGSAYGVKGAAANGYSVGSAGTTRAGLAGSNGTAGSSGGSLDGAVGGSGGTAGTTGGTGGAAGAGNGAVGGTGTVGATATNYGTGGGGGGGGKGGGGGGANNVNSDDHDGNAGAGGDGRAGGTGGAGRCVATTTKVLNNAFTASTNGAGHAGGVYGANTDPNNTGYGVIGENLSPTGYGIYSAGNAKVVGDMIVTGKMGVGTANPDYPLEVQGNVLIDGTLTATGGIISGSGVQDLDSLADVIADYSFSNMFLGNDSGTVATGSANTALGTGALSALTTGNSNTALGSNAGAAILTGSNNIIIGTDTDVADPDGADQLNIGNTIFGNLGTGSIGLGTTAPLALLQLGETTYAADARLRFATGNGTNLRSWSIGTQYGDTVVTAPNYGFIIRDETAGADRLVIDWATGNVGIGTETPTDKLTLVDETNAGIRFYEYNNSDGANIRGNRARGTAAAPAALLANDRISALTAFGYDGSAFTVTARASLSMFAAENWTTTANGTDIRFDTTPIGTQSPVERLRIDPSGNVGIGTTAPLKFLHVGAGADTPIMGAQGITVQNAGATGIAVRDATGDVENILYASGADGAVVGAASNHSLSLRTNNQNRLVIDTSGNATINGNLTVTGAVSGGSNNIDALSDAIASVPLATVFLGSQTGIANTTGGYNTGIGYRALTANTTGSNNTAISDGALQNNTTGGNNTALGNNTLSYNVARQESTAVGYGAMTYANSAGTAGITYNTALGAYALRGAVGGQATNTGTRNTAVGHSTMISSTTGGSNTAVGTVALSANTTGSSNTAVGDSALASNVSGVANTAVGLSALVNNTSHNNTAVGRSALMYNTSGQRNTGIGVNVFNTGSTNTTGSDNTAIGYGVGVVISSGSNNTLIGSGVASTTLTTGSSNILIGTSSAVTTPAAATSNFLNIGNAIFATGMTGTVAAPAGNVGIGTAAPIQALHVVGNNNATNIFGNGFSGVSWGTLGLNLYYDSTALAWKFREAAGTWGYNIAGGGGGISFQPSASASTGVGSAANPVTRMFISAAGNVGIGPWFTTPNTRLHVSGVDDNTYGQLEIQSSGNDARLSLYNANGASTTGRGDILMSRTAGFEGIRFMINNSDKMIVDENGNVGIGTTAPGAKAEIVAGGAPPATSGSTQNGNILRLRSQATDLVLDVGTDTFPWSTWIQATNRTNLSLNYNLLLNPNGGNVGIGTMTPGQKLTVAGNMSSTIMYDYDNGAYFVDPASSSTLNGKVQIGNTGTDYLPAATNWNYALQLNGLNTTSIGFHDAGCCVGSIRYAGNVFTIGADDGWGVGSLSVGGTVTAAGYFHSSDLRLKQNVQTLDDGLNTVLNLRGVRFDWKKNGRASYGVIAQEVEQVLPAAVATDSEGMKSVDYDALLAPMIEAVKTLAQQIKQLADKVADVAAKVTGLIEEQVKILSRLDAHDDELAALKKEIEALKAKNK